MDQRGVNFKIQTYKANGHVLSYLALEGSRAS